MTDRPRRLAQYSRYNVGPKGRVLDHRRNRTAKRLSHQRERNQVRRERLARREILTLAKRGTR
jgi:hypothetical protein